MAYNFLPCDRNQSYLLPPSLVDWLPEYLRDRNNRIDRLKACQERLDCEQAEARQAQQDKIDRRKAKEEATDKPHRCAMLCWQCY